MLVLDTKVKVIKASEKGNLMVKQVRTKCIVGKPQVGKNLKTKVK